MNTKYVYHICPPLPFPYALLLQLVHTLENDVFCFYVCIDKIKGIIYIYTHAHIWRERDNTILLVGLSMGTEGGRRGTENVRE
jgi:hypothetical protein